MERPLSDARSAGRHTADDDSAERTNAARQMQQIVDECKAQATQAVAEAQRAHAMRRALESRLEASACAVAVLRREIGEMEAALSQPREIAATHPVDKHTADDERSSLAQERALEERRLSLEWFDPAQPTASWLSHVRTGELDDLQQQLELQRRALLNGQVEPPFQQQQLPSQLEHGEPHNVAPSARAQLPAAEGGTESTHGDAVITASKAANEPPQVMLGSMPLLVRAGTKSMSLTFLHRLISTLTFAKLCHNQTKMPNGQAPLPMPEFVAFQTLSMYGVRKMAQTYVEQM
eukprot:870093-Prymnesium_polylepis.1